MDSKHPIIIALGSNHQAKERMATAKELLRRVFDDVSFSPTIWTEPIGTACAHYLNCVAWATTSRGEQDTIGSLKAIERQCGDCHRLRQENKVLLDLDLLFFHDHRLHEKDWERPYIQRLMKAGGKREETA